MTIYVIILMGILSQIGFSGTRVAVSLYALELGASQFTVGLLIALFSFFPTLLAIAIGRFSDRVAPWVPILMGMLGMGLGMMLPPLLPGLATLYVAVVILGIFHQFFLIPLEASFGGIGGAENRARNYALLSMGWSVANFAGPFIAGLTIDYLGNLPVFWVLAAFALLPVLILWYRPHLLPRTAAHGGKEKHGGVLELWRMPNLRIIYISGGIISSAQDLFQFYFPIYGHSIGLSASAIGTIIGVVALAAFVIRSVIPMLMKRLTEVRILTYAVMVAAFAFTLLPFVTNAYALAAIAFLLGLGVGCANPMSMSLIYALSPSGRVAESLGLRKTLNSFIHVTVPLFFGSIGTAFGFYTVFLSNSVILAAGAALMRRARIDNPHKQD